MNQGLALALILASLTIRPAPAAAPLAAPATPAARARPAPVDNRVELRDLKRELRDRRPEKRRRAVQKLAELDLHEGWELVLGALRDPDPQVGDQAQLAVTEWADPRGVLLGKEGLASRHEIVRLRVAESFGRRRERVDGAALARHLDPRDGRVSRMLLWSLERLGRDGLLFEVGDAMTRRVEACLRANLDPGLRADALTALAALDRGRAREALAQLSGDRDAAVRCAALALGTEFGDEGLAATCAAALSDEAVSVRSQAIACLEGCADRSAVAWLAQALEGERRPRLRVELVSALQRLTGRKYRDDPQPWKLFASRLAADWSPAAAAETELDTERSAAFAGLPILSDRVCFLVDFSGSLWHEREDGRTPKDVVDRELRTALEGLPAGTEFNVVPYTREPHPWREQVIESRPGLVADALRYFERCRETGPGSFFEAARFALADERVDGIVVLTDGAPTGGEHYDLDLLFELLVHENRYRRVVFDSVLVEAAPLLQARWTEFTGRTGGRSIAVRLDDAEAVLRPQGG